MGENGVSFVDMGLFNLVTIFAKWSKTGDKVVFRTVFLFVKVMVKNSMLVLSSYHKNETDKYQR